MKNIIQTIKAWPLKKKIIALCIVGVVFWVCFRVGSLIEMAGRSVFNEVRSDLAYGIPVNTMVATKQNDTLSEPLIIKNNRALVTGARVNLFSAGQKINKGEIVSVSSRIDIDSGMYVIKTRGVEDGLQYAQYSTEGFFVPVYAVTNGGVLVMENGVAKYRKVEIKRQDADRALITSGLDDGDIVVLSNVADGSKVRKQQSK